MRNGCTREAGGVRHEGEPEGRGTRNPMRNDEHPEGTRMRDESEKRGPEAETGNPVRV